MKSEDILIRADEKFDAGEIDSSLTLYQQAANMAEQENNNSVLVESYSQIARCYLKQDDLEECHRWLAKVEDIVSDEDSRGWSRYLGVRGRLEWKEAAKEASQVAPVADKAAQTFEQMYEYCLKHDLYKRAVDAAHMVAIVGDMEKRLEWGLRGIEAAEQGNMEKWLGPLWNNHGWNLHDAGKYKESLEALKVARDYHYKGDRELPKLIADWSVGYAYRKVGDLNSAKTWMGDVYRRIDSLYNADSSADHAEWLGFAKKELGEIALTEKRIPEALQYLTEAKSHLVEAGMPQWDKKGYEELESKIKSLYDK